MSLSCFLAVAMAMNGASAGSIPLPQDTTKPGGENTQSTAPAPAEPAPDQAGKKEAPADAATAAEDAKKSDDAREKDEATKTNEAGKPAPANRKKHTARKAASEGEPRKVVVRRGGALEPTAQIAPDIPPEEALKQRQKAEEMLVAAEGRLKVLAGRTLEPAQQETTTQIRNYMEKARSALKDGDTQRGHTLALKAYLLADDLMKH
jgi:hypothetical protein